MKWKRWKRWPGLALFLTVIALVIALDQASKIWVEHNFALFESQEILPGLFSLTFLTNNGAAFSLLSGEPTWWRQVFFLVISCAALVFITIAQRSYGPWGRLYSIALGMIAGGAAGNLIDRLRLGYVIDFIDFYIGSSHWPAFNVADSAICLGVFLFLLKNLVIDRGRLDETDSTSKHERREQA